MELQTINLRPPPGTRVADHDVDGFAIEYDAELDTFDFRLELGQGLAIFWALPAARNDRLRLILVDGAAFHVDEPVLYQDPFVGDLDLRWDGHLAMLLDGSELIAASIRMTADPASYEFEVQTYWGPRDLDRTERLVWHYA